MSFIEYLRAVAVEAQLMTFDEYVALVERARAEYPEWREGQAYFNVLSVLHPGLADDINGTNNDPFYRDEAIGAFLDVVRERW